MRLLSPKWFLTFLIGLVILPVYLSAQNLDIEILRAINSPEDLPSDDFFRFISNSEPYIVAAVPVAIGGYGLIRHDDKQFRTGCVIVAATAFCAGVTNILKYTIDRERPFVTYPDITKKSDAGSPSFPSGHTSSAFATATSLSLAFSKWYVIVPSYGWAATVGYSRMHLGVHYPSDVLAGAVIGAGSAWLTHYLNKKLLARQH
jgi:membrane-associated phospholipid phosphatase